MRACPPASQSTLCNDLLNLGFQSKRNYKHSGLIHLIHSHTVHAYSFLDYIRGGTELACTISIDFTQSNGNPTDPRYTVYRFDNRSLNSFVLT